MSVFILILIFLFSLSACQLVAIASSALDTYRAEAKTMVVALVDMERMFVPPAHFIEAEYKK